MADNIPQINPWNKFFLSLKNLLPGKHGELPTSRAAIEQLNEYQMLLASCQSMWNSKDEFRRECEINRRYYFGDQFCEMIPNPDGCGAISERQYLINQGMTPLSINLIRVNNIAVEGMFTGDKMDPLVKSRIREEQKIGELLTIVMKKLYQSQNIYGLCARGYEDFRIRALPAFRVGWGWDEQRKEFDVFAERCDINRMFWDDNIGNSEQYFSKVTTIGYLHDMSKDEVLRNFSHSPEDAAKIDNAYAEWRDKYATAYTQQFKKNNEQRYIDFFTPEEFYKCRVIEVWRKETHAVWACHDTGDGTWYTLPGTSEARAEIEAVNAQRQAQLAAAGGDPNDSPIIEYEYRLDTDWVVRYLTPNGYLLRQEIPNFLHGSHPFVIGAFPLVDGQVCSAVQDQRSIQRVINRTFMRDEFMEMNKAKGFKWVNKNILDRTGITPDQIAEKYTSHSAIVALDIKEGEENRIMGSVDKTGEYNSGPALNKIQFLSEIMDRVSGTPGSVRGERPTSGTPSSLYAQQTQNANNNIADPLEWYYGLINQLDYKLMMLVLQNYDLERYLRIVGDDYRQEIEYIIGSDQRDILCDVALIKSPSNGVARAETENMLQLLLQYGIITGEEFLEATSTHGADKLLEKVRARMQEQAEAQQQAAMNQQQAAALQQAQAAAAQQQAMQGAAPAAPAPPMG